MLGLIKINWFRCLREVTLPLAPLTVLVGPNASGKSAVLDALNPTRILHQRDLWNRDMTRRFMFRFEFTNEPRDSVVQGELSPSQSVGQLARYEYQLLRLDLSALRLPNAVQEERRLLTNGENLTNVFASLSRSTQIEIGHRLRELVGVIADVEARPHPSEVGKNTLIFQDAWNLRVRYFPNEVSDGTMLLLAFLVCQHQEPAPTLLAIEEPERGLHPYLLQELVTMLRAMSSGQHGGPPVQVIAATHSAELLDSLQPEEVRFLRRDSADGGVQVECAPVDMPEWQQVIEEYRHSLRSVWLSGGLGGVPGR